jgi:hypothetical protein
MKHAPSLASKRERRHGTSAGALLLLGAAWLFGACVADSSSNGGENPPGGSGGGAASPGSGGSGVLGSGGALGTGSGGAGTNPPGAGTGGAIPSGTGGDTGALGSGGGTSTGGAAPISTGGSAGGSATSGGNSGGGGGGGGTTAGGTAGTAGPPGPAGGGCGTAKICDDFESYASPTNLAPWTTSVSGGSVMIDGTHVYSGKQSVLIHADAGANKKAQINRMGAPLFPANPNLFWGRMMVYMGALPASSVHYDNVQGDGTGTGQYRIGGMGGILLNYEPHDCYDHIMPMLPQNKWSCWQWLYDGTKNAIQFYVDGKLQAQVMSTSQGCVDGTNSVWAAPMFTAVHLGWVNYQATTTGVDLWLDDVALGPDQIACPALAAGAH